MNYLSIYNVSQRQEITSESYPPHLASKSTKMKTKQKRITKEEKNSIDYKLYKLFKKYENI